MDIATVLGLVLGFGCVFGGMIMEGGSPAALISISSSIIVIGGTIAVGFVSFPLARMTGMAKVLASELAPRGIRVNTVIPGGTRTPIWTRGAREGTPLETTEKALAPTIPLGRLNEADEVAQAVFFLASSAASGMTAAEIVIDGGQIGAPWGAPILRPIAG